MPRPTRIEYPDAFYHVMNRGRDKGRFKLFHSEEYFELFIQTLSETCERFNLIVHAYCLMSNHYHLLVQTPEANLGRAMRHLNGVYTQRHNIRKKTDGPLFRGRYKAVIVDEDSYLLQLSRYIHRNPIETKRPMVEALSDYTWSSYPAYINRAPAPKWLEREKSYQMLGKRDRYVEYQRYVGQANSETITKFYGRGNIATTIGDKDFVTWLIEEKVPELEDKRFICELIPDKPSVDTMVRLVSEFYKIKEEEIRRKISGPQKGRWPRKFAMYLCQQLAGYSLKEIMQAFELSHVGSVSFITSQVRQAMQEDLTLVDEVKRLQRYIVKNAT
jgi:putative transposase